MKTKDEIKVEIRRLRNLEDGYKAEGSEVCFERQDNLEQAVRCNVARRKLEWVLGW